MEQRATVRLGDIEVRSELNPRAHLRTERIQEYTRRLQNGEMPPPMIVHAGKMVLWDGAQRFGAWKSFVGDDWKAYEVEVILRDDLPDPDGQPHHFRATAAGANNHGEPLTRYERRMVAAQVAAKDGIDVALRYANMLGETTDSLKSYLEQYWATLVRPSTIALESVGIVAELAPMAPRNGSTQAPRTPYDPGEFPTGHLHFPVPELRDACRKLRKVLLGVKTPLLEVDEQELLLTLNAVKQVLGDMEKAA
jgi:hypothetical protein